MPRRVLSPRIPLTCRWGFETTAFVFPRLRVQQRKKRPEYGMASCRVDCSFRNNLDCTLDQLLQRWGVRATEQQGGHQREEINYRAGEGI